VDYIEFLQLELSEWHAPRGCPSSQLDYMKIPVVEGKPLGQS
jgi:hypothetical protein